MALTDVYEVRVRYKLQSKPQMNVFHAFRVTPLADATDIIAAFINSVLPAWLNAVHTAVLFDDIEADNLGDPTDFDAISISGSAGLAGAVLVSKFNAIGIRFPRKTKAIGHGFKRFSGVSEEMLSSGVLTATAEALFNTLGSAIVSPWQGDIGAGTQDIATFAVVKRIPYTAPSGKTAYRLPETEAELDFYQPDSAIVQLEVTSQNSRKTN